MSSPRLARLETTLAGRARLVVALLCVLAVLARVAYALVAVSPQLTDDETSFWAVAGNLAAGRGFSYEGAPTAWRPPLYTGALAVARAMGAGVRAVQLLQALAGAATVAATWFLARRLDLPRWASALAAGIVAVYPPFVHFASQVLSENLALPLLVLALGCTVAVLRRPQPAIGAAALTGLVWGAAVLARPAALVGLAVAALALLLRRGAMARRALAAGALGLAAVALIAPWTVRNAVAVGGPAPVVSNEGFTLWVSNRLDAVDLKDFRDPAYPGLEDYGVYGRAFPGIAREARRTGFDFTGASEAERDAWFRDRFTEAVRADPLRFARRAAAKTLAALSPAPDNASREEATSPLAKAALIATSGPVLVVGLAGLGVWLVRGGAAERFLAVSALASLVGLATHLPYVRYRAGAVDPILVVAAAALLARLVTTTTSAHSPETAPASADGPPGRAPQRARMAH